MKFVDQSFYVPRIPVAVVDCGATGEALLLRSLLESMNAVVTLHQPGTPADFLLVLSETNDAPNFIALCAHGDENGFVFGSYASDIDTSCLVNGSLPSQALVGKVSLAGRVVLSTACGTGSKAFGEVFLAAGVRAYIAPSTEPEGADVALFLHHFFHEVLCRGSAPESAYSRAHSYDVERANFVLYTANA